MYAALISRSASLSPQLVSLSDSKKINKLLKARIRKDGSNYIANPFLSHQLYKLIWEPLKPHLEGINTIYLSPSGLLHRVAFGALQVDKTKDVKLLEQYEIAYFGNLRDLILKKERQIIKKKIVLIGGAQFDLDSLSLVDLAKKEKGTYFKEKEKDRMFSEGLGRSIMDDSTRTIIEFNDLPGTLEEVKAIGRLFEKEKWNTKMLLRENALEGHIKALHGKHAPNILHIATHGYFFSPFKRKYLISKNTMRDRIKYANNPLLRSGLVFTGSNHVWKGGQTIAGIDDGILTALEISNMDLSNTFLVVLSACETGLGDIYNGEGVFGLQRAFKSAGVKNMIISLWKVPDKETSILMEYFYQNYLKGLSPRIALQQAQLKMNTEYPAYYWAGFILIE